MDNFATVSFAFVSLDLPFVCWFAAHTPFEATKRIWNFEFWTKNGLLFQRVNLPFLQKLVFVWPLLG